MFFEQSVSLGLASAFLAILMLIVGLVMSVVVRAGARQKREAALENARLEQRKQDLQAQIHQAELALATATASLASRDNSFQELRREALVIKRQFEEQSVLRQRAEQALDVEQTKMQEREASFAKQIAQFEQQKSELKKEFELLANRIFEEKGRAFESQSKTQMDSVLKPFKDQLEGFQKRVNDVHDQSVQGRTKLEEQIKSVLDVGMRMSDEAQTLASALKGDKKAQGCWSEVQAELLLEMSGLQEGREFERETSFKTEDGRDQRPDFVVNLPNDKHIIIDSKISLVAYVNASGAETEEEHTLYMRAHVEAIRNHVKSLSDKNYPALKGINSPEYVFMFMGNEPAYLAAAEFDPNLFNDAYRKGIAIVTPNTLLSSLRIVAHLWSIDKQNSNTRKLAEQGTKVYEKLRVFVEKIQKLGVQLNTVQKTYDDSWATLKDGRGSLAKQVDKFVDMGVTVKQKLPSELTDEYDPGLNSLDD